MKKVLIITYYWPPSGGGGVQRWVKFVKYFPEFEVEPIVITVDPKYASFPIIDKSMESDISEAVDVYKTKSLEPLKLYKGLNPRKEIPFGGFANEQRPGLFQKVSRFIRGNLFIPDARIGWNKYALKMAEKIITDQQIDTIVTTSPPHSTQLIGRSLKRKYNVKWIADLRDPWTDIYYYNKLYHTSISSAIDKKLELSVLNESDSIVVVSDSIKKLFSDKLKSGMDKKLHVIPNGFDTPDFDFDTPIEQSESLKKMKIVYTGTIADNYNINGFLKAVSNVIDINPEIELNLCFVGRVSDKYVSIIKGSNLKDITTFINHVNHNQAISYMLGSDVLFLSIPDVPDNEGILTGKLFEYLASRKPIIGVGPVNGDAASIIVGCESGKMFNYNDITELRNYILSLYNLWINKGLEITNNNFHQFSRRNLAQKFSELI